MDGIEGAGPHCCRGACPRTGGGQVLRGRVADRDLDFVVLAVAGAVAALARAVLVVALWRSGRRDRCRGAVRAAVTVWRLGKGCAPAPVDAQRQSLLVESATDPLGTCARVRVRECGRTIIAQKSTVTLNCRGMTGLRTY